MNARATLNVFQVLVFILIPTTPPSLNLALIAFLAHSKQSNVYQIHRNSRRLQVVDSSAGSARSTNAACRLLGL